MCISCRPCVDVYEGVRGVWPMRTGGSKTWFVDVINGWPPICVQFTFFKFAFVASPYFHHDTFLHHALHVDLLDTTRVDIGRSKLGPYNGESSGYVQPHTHRPWPRHWPRLWPWTWKWPWPRTWKVNFVDKRFVMKTPFLVLSAKIQFKSIIRRVRIQSKSRFLKNLITVPTIDGPMVLPNGS